MSVPSRITQSMITSTMLGDLQRSSSEVAKLSRQVATGQRIQSASDDPLGAHRALRLQSELDGVAGYRSGAHAVGGWTATAESALDGITSAIHRARELIVQASSDTYSASDRQKIAGELGQLLEQVKADANAKFGDQYVFSGQASATAPYSAGASDAYAGDGASVTRAIGPGQQVVVNIPGSQVLGSGGGDGQLLDTLRSAIADLSSGTPAAIDNLRTNGLAALNQNLDTVLTSRAQLGAASNRASMALSRLDDVELTTQAALQDVAGANLAETITKLSAQQTAYQAALHSGANIIQPSLMDFLR